MPSGTKLTVVARLKIAEQTHIGSKKKFSYQNLKSFKTFLSAFKTYNFFAHQTTQNEKKTKKKKLINGVGKIKTNIKKLTFS